jgi:predicted flap endonuclease-1-like 5' DNA nuclease
MIPIGKVAGVGQALAALLAAKGISTAEQLAKTSPEALRSIPRLGARSRFWPRHRRSLRDLRAKHLPARQPHP